MGLGGAIYYLIKGFHSTMKLNFKEKKSVTLTFTSKGLKKTDVWRKPNSHRGREHNETEQIYTWHVSMSVLYCYPVR